MRRNTLLLILLLLTFAGGLGYFRFVLAEKFTKQEAIEAPPTVAQSSSAAPMELNARQKVLQLVAYPVVLSNTPKASGSAAVLSAAAQDFLAKESPGFVTFFGSSITASTAQQAVSEVKSANAEAMYSPLFAVDHEGGTVQRFTGTGFTKLPSFSSWCTDQSDQKLQIVGDSAKELKKVGIDIIFAPVVDVATSSSFLRTRLCSSDSQVVIGSSESWGRQFASQGIMPVIKHYPGIGTVAADLHRQFATISPPAAEKNLFSEILKDYPNWGVMISHAGVVSPNGGAIPCSLDSQCVQPLRKAFPNALIFTDSLEMKALQPKLSVTSSASAQVVAPVEYGELSVQAIKAGSDVLVFGSSVSSAQFTEIIDHLTKEYEANPSFKSLVDERVQKILGHKQVR